VTLLVRMLYSTFIHGHLIGGEGIQAGRRFVQKQQPRVVRHQPEPYVDPLRLPACGGQSVSLSGLQREPVSDASLTPPHCIVMPASVGHGACKRHSDTLPA